MGLGDQAAAEAAEVAALLAAENVALVAEEDRDRLGPLDALTGVPRGDDVLLFARPVRALRSGNVGRSIDL